MPRRSTVRRDDSWKPIANAAMDRYACGDDTAFSELYDLLFPRLHAFVLRQTRDAALTQDLIQQTFLRMHAARRHFAPGAEVLPWAFAIARRLLIDDSRRNGRQASASGDANDAEAGEAVSGELGPEAAMAHLELGRSIERALSRLPEAQRIAFELVKREHLSMAEAAQVLGTTEGAVKLRAHRGYEALRAALAEVMDDWHDD
jgi:RNA polymerase sigma factor (sigma-70 family)